MYLKVLAQNLLYAIAPRTAAAFFAIRSRRKSQQIISSWGARRVLDKIVTRYGTAVLAGPFKGLKLTQMTFQENVSPYLLGVYENELESAWYQIFQSNFSQILDVGSKFGFYACGLAQRFCNTPVIAFDTDPWARRATLEMARVNGVASMIAVEKYCDKNWLNKYLKRHALIICDCEGYESQLFSSPIASNVRSSTLIIECHDHIVPRVTESILERLELTHHTIVVPSCVGSKKSSLDLSFLEKNELELALSDTRPAQSWVYAVPSTIK